MANTVNRAYPRPDTGRTIADEFPVSDQALVMIDADIAELIAALIGKADAAHGHAIEDIAGLATALDGKAGSGHAHALDDLTDVSGASGAADGYILVKTSVGWVPSSPAAALGNHEHSVAQIQGLQGALDAKITTAMIAAASQKTTPVDADMIGYLNSEDGNALVRATWANFKSSIKTYFDTLYQSAGSASYQIGQYVTVAGNTLPPGCVWAYGQNLLISDVPEYFAEVGTLYGGNGTTTVGVPDRRGRVGAGKDNMGGTAANRLTGTSGGVPGATLGAVGGAQQHAMITAEMPAHQHQLTKNYAWGGAGGITWYSGQTQGSESPWTTSAGGNAPHNNVQPTIIENVAIYVGGIY